MLRRASYQKENSKSLQSGEETSTGRIVARNKHKAFSQVAVLSRRYFKLVWNDKLRLLLLLIQAPVLAFLISLVKDGSEYYNAQTTKALLFALSCSAFWLGTLNSIDEVCKERIVLRREYMAELHLRAYVFSKFVVLSVLCLVQNAMLTGVHAKMVGLPEKEVIWNPAIEFMIPGFLMALAMVGCHRSTIF